MLVYCDTNVYCRPLDDQSQPRIKAEAEAFLGILERVERTEITLVGSDILTAEVSRISSTPKRNLVKLYLAHCTRHIPASTQIVQIADEIVKQARLKPEFEAIVLNPLEFSSLVGGRIRSKKGA